MAMTGILKLYKLHYLSATLLKTKMAWHIAMFYFYDWSLCLHTTSTRQISPTISITYFERLTL